VTLGEVDRTQIFILSSLLLSDFKFQLIFPWLNLEAGARVIGSSLEAPNVIYNMYSFPAFVWEFIRIGSFYILRNLGTNSYVKFGGASNLILSSFCDYSLDYAWEFQYIDARPDAGPYFKIVPAKNPTMVWRFNSPKSIQLVNDVYTVGNSRYWIWRSLEYVNI